MADANPVYLCYDLKGIQSFIFAIPKLKYIVGGSALIDRFDRMIASTAVETHGFTGVTRLFTGGGKGAFRCSTDEQADELTRYLREKAHKDGLSISFGRNSDYAEAALQTEQTYPYLPQKREMEGNPCPESGLYPTDGSAHSAINKRVWQKGGHMARHYEEELLKSIATPGALLDDKERLVFFHDVSLDTDNGKAGQAALGNRNRWAVIAMDGNDMGRQHQAGKKLSGETYETWLGHMSTGLDETSRRACIQGIAAVIQEWVNDLSEEKPKAGDIFKDCRDQDGDITLPIRPLVVGGDDVIVLCHVSHAMTFVKRVCEAFEQHSGVLAETFGGGLWPATGDRLTISAGVLYAPDSLPLATAITYAESLLASAKKRGREKHRIDGKSAEGKPVPACVDWESVTEGVIDTPAARRQRELLFYDEDCCETVKLTTRPVTLEEFGEIERLKQRYQDIPGTIRHGVLRNLRAAFWDRKVYLARLGKRSHALVGDIEEGDKPRDLPRGLWKRMEADPDAGAKHPVRSTPVPDALLLLEEEHRMCMETVLEDHR